MAIGDMFLKVETAKQGVIKGEANDATHGTEIDVVGWSWGLHAHSGLGAGGASSKATLDELRIVKKVDSASTALMATLRSNELIKKAVLTVRKAGGSPLEYLVITLQNARITDLGLDTQNDQIVERVNFAYNKISVQYKAQGTEGLGRGAMTFDADSSPA